MAATRAGDLYEADFYAWALDQAAAVRRLAASRPNVGNLVEEIEGLARSERDAALSQLDRLVVHLLTLEHSPSDRPRRGWLLGVINARSVLRRKMTDALRPAVEAELPAVYETARRAAAIELAGQDERHAARALPAACPYPLDRLLDPDWLPANRHGVVDGEES